MIQRRNSTLSFIDWKGQRAVEKRYHSEYDINEEFEKILQLDKIVMALPKYRTVKVLKHNEDSLILERLEDLSLELLNRQSINLLQENLETFLGLFQQCETNKFSFDCDLSNIFYDSESDQFIIIDPVQSELGIKHLSFIVFTLSFFKSIGKTRRFLLLCKISSLFKSYTERYCTLLNVQSKVIKDAFEQYIDVVITWNNIRNDQEVFLKFVFRKVLYISIWRLIRLYIRKSI